MLHFIHKNSKMMFIFILNLIYLFTASCKETKCLSHERWWMFFSQAAGKEEWGQRFIKRCHINIISKWWMRKHFEIVSHTASVPWLNWLLNPDFSGVHFWHIQKSFGQTALLGHPSRKMSLVTSPESILLQNAVK